MQDKKKRTAALTALVCLACSGTAFAATDVTAVDIQQLEKAPGLVVNAPEKAKAYEQESVDASGNVTMSISDREQAAAAKAVQTHADAAAIMKMPLRWESVEEPFQEQQEEKAKAEKKAQQKKAEAAKKAEQKRAVPGPAKKRPIILTADDLPQPAVNPAPAYTPQPLRPEKAAPQRRKPHLSWHTTHDGKRPQPPVTKKPLSPQPPIAAPQKPERPLPKRPMRPPMPPRPDVRRALPPKQYRPLPVPKNVRLAAFPDERTLPETGVTERPEPFRDISESSWRHIQAGIYAMQLQLRTDISEPAIFHFVQILNANTGLTRLQKLQYLIGFGYAINHSSLSDWQKGALIDTIAQSFE